MKISRSTYFDALAVMILSPKFVNFWGQDLVIRHCVYVTIPRDLGKFSSFKEIHKGWKYLCMNIIISLIKFCPLKISKKC